MSKFKVGDRIRLTDKCQYLGARHGYKAGDIGVIVSDKLQESLAVKMENPKNGYECLWCCGSELEYAEKTPPKEITQNGSTYVLKEEPKPEHEWEFGDIAVHEEYGVGIVVSKPDTDDDVYFVYNNDWRWIYIEDLTFIRRADLSV